MNNVFLFKELIRLNFQDYDELVYLLKNGNIMFA